MEVTKLLNEIKEELARKDETYRLIADSKPNETCQCRGCMPYGPYDFGMISKAVKERASKPGAHPYACTCWTCYEEVFGTKEG